MPALPLTTALAPYGHVKALTDGTLSSERVVCEPLQVSPITSAFRRMVWGIVVKDALLQEHPWLAAELYRLFVAAKVYYLDHLDLATPSSPADVALQSLQPIVGPNPLPYGVAPNRRTLEAFIEFNVEQQIMPHSVAVEDLFPRSGLDLL